MSLHNINVPLKDVLPTHRQDILALNPYAYPSKNFDFSENLPRPKRGSPMAREHIQHMLFAGAALPYNGEWDAIDQQRVIDPDFEGCTYGEVIVMRLIQKAAAGEDKALKEFFDRTLGKPKQAVETVSMRLSYTEYLDMLSQDGELEEDDSPVIDITPPTEAMITDSIFDDPEFALEDDTANSEPYYPEPELADLLKGI